MDSKIQLLICDDDSIFHLKIKHLLPKIYECHSSFSSDEALSVLQKQPIDIILLDICMRSRDEGLKVLPKILQMKPGVSVVISSALTDLRAVRKAFTQGAVDYISKDFEDSEIVHTLNQLIQKQDLQTQPPSQDRSNRNAPGKNSSFRNQPSASLIGESPSIQRLRKILEKVRKSQANVIITGETGTGKEVVAKQLIPAASGTAQVPFIAIDSSTIQGSMAESILFGHEKGAFTGADSARKGIFEEAHGGIVYFDEIGNMPLSIQAKLLRVLQEKEVLRLGSSRPIPLEFRIICATNQCLEERAEKGEFKDDLLQRLNVFPIHIPPLRDRLEDLPLLLNHFIRTDHAALEGFSFAEETLDLLVQYSWPGNIRELRNLVSYLAVIWEGGPIRPHDLPTKLNFRGKSPSRTLRTEQVPAELPFHEQMLHYEKKILLRAYEDQNGNVSKLSSSLRIDRSHLYTKLKAHGIYKGRTKKGRTNRQTEPLNST